MEPVLPVFLPISGTKRPESATNVQQDSSSTLRLSPACALPTSPISTPTPLVCPATLLGIRNPWPVLPALTEPSGIQQPLLASALLISLITVQMEHALLAHLPISGMKKVKDA